MLIEKMFYDITKQQWQDMVKDCDTEKEILSKKDTYKSELSDFITKGKSLQSQKTVNAQKREFFALIQTASLEIAKTAAMNIKTELSDDETFGYIEFSFGELWIVEETPQECRRIMSLLYEHATEICTSIESDLVIQRFIFMLTE